MVKRLPVLFQVVALIFISSTFSRFITTNALTDTDDSTTLSTTDTSIISTTTPSVSDTPDSSTDTITTFTTSSNNIYTSTLPTLPYDTTPSCPILSTPTRTTATLGSPCDPPFYQSYGVPFQGAFYAGTLYPDKASSYHDELVVPLLVNYSRDDCFFSASNLICNSAANYFNEPLQCGAESGKCECLRSPDILGIMTTQEIGTTGCLAEEGSFCWDKGDPNVSLESRKVGLLCGFGNICVNNRCTRFGFGTSSSGIVLSSKRQTQFKHTFLLSFIIVFVLLIR